MMNHGVKHMICFFLIGLSGTVTWAQGDSIKVERLPFNTRNFNELAPVILEDGLLFSTDIKTSLFVDYKNQDDQRMYDLYIVEQKDSIRWGNPRLFSRNLTTVFNEGSASYHADSRTLYFTRNLSLDKKNRSDENNVGIFYARRSGDRWVNARPLPINDPAFNTAFPCISNDGNILYFASDRPEGYGQYDLYVTRLENGSWTEPENLGPRINSSRSEVYPFIGEDGWLYYSSNNNSVGGMDIFYTKQAGKNWSIPVRFDAPINSRRDDFAYVLKPGGEAGYFTSNRDNSDDIFSFSALEPPKPGIAFNNCAEQEENSYCYLFYESGVMDLDTLPFIYEWEFGDGNRKRGLSVEHCYDTSGIYRAQLNVIDSLMGQVMYNEASLEVNALPIEQAFITSLDTLYIGETARFDGTIESYFPDLTVEEYYWDFGDGVQTAGTQVDHTYEIPGNYQVNLKVTGSRNDPPENKEYCSYKNVVVLERKP